MEKTNWKKMFVAVLFTFAFFIIAASVCEAKTKITPIPEGANFELLKDIEILGSEFYLYSPNIDDINLTSLKRDSVLFVYPDRPYRCQEEAWRAMVKNRLIDLAGKNSIFIIMPMPLNGSNWTEADLDLYHSIQFWLFGGEPIEFPYTWQYPQRAGNHRTYIMAEGEGAAFVHNVLSKNANRIAGVLTFGGRMTNFAEGLSVPAYLVNADYPTTEYYKTVNETDTEPMPGVFVNSDFLLKTVITKHRGRAFDRFKPQLISDAWERIFSRTARINLNGWELDDSEWVLNDRPNYTALGITRIDHNDDTLPDGTVATWYDFVPNSILRHAHQKHHKGHHKKKVPLVIALHGADFVPLDQAESTGWVAKASEEEFILITPLYSGINYESENILLNILEYAKSTYPIDESRVYLSGYSMGGLSSAIYGLLHTDKFAAIAVMGALGIDDPYLAAWVDFIKDEVDLPFMILIGANDSLNVGDCDGNPCVTGLIPGMDGLKLLKQINELPEYDYDYASYPYWGFPTEDARVEISKDLYFDVSYLYKDEEPLGKFVIFEEGGHMHEDYYATLAWDLFSDFSR